MESFLLFVGGEWIHVDKDAVGLICYETLDAEDAPQPPPSPLKKRETQPLISDVYRTVRRRIKKKKWDEG